MMINTFFAFCRRHFVLASLCACVILPYMLFLIYLLAYATPRYQSEFRIQIRSSAGNNSTSLGQILGLTGGSSQASDNGYAITQYLQSLNAVRDLEQKVALRSHYTAPYIDGFSRLDKDAPVEAVGRYWNRRLNAYYESTTGTVVAQVTAFTPQEANLIANAALQQSETLLNEMTTRSRNDSLRYAEQEYTRADDNLKNVSAQWLAMRNQTGVIDAPKETSASISIVTNLKQNAAQARADVAMLERVLSPDAPALLFAKSRLKTATDQLKAAEAQATSQGGGKGKSLANVVNHFELLEGQKNFAEKRVEAALANLHNAQSEANRQQLYLDTIVHPQVAEEPSAPKPWRDSFIFLAFAFGLWAMALILGRSVRDHIRA